MDKAVEEIFKIFNHLARELQIYCLSGVLILVNCLLIDFFLYNHSLWTLIQNTKDLAIPILVITYILGQLSMAFYYLLLERPKRDEWIKKVLGFNHTEKSALLHQIYIKNKEAYLHFVERYDLLTMMRWTMSAACALSFFIDIIFLFFNQNYWQQLGSIAILFLLGAISLYMLAVQTEYDYVKHIEGLANDIEA